MKVHFTGGYDNDRIIGEADTLAECWDIVHTFMDKHNYISYYQIWNYNSKNNRCVIDVGSWSQFFEIECSIEEYEEYKKGN